MVRDIYGVYGLLEYEKRRCQEDLTQSQATCFMHYAQHLLAQGLRPTTVTRTIGFLRQATLITGKTLSRLTEKELLDLLEEVNAKDLSQVTIDSYLIILRRYMDHILKGRRVKHALFMQILRAIKKRRKNEIRIPLRLLTEEDISRLISAAKNDEIKAIIGFMWASGARIGEVLNIKKDDMLFDENGCVVRIEGKTGCRRIRVIDNFEALASVWGLRKQGEYLFHYRYAGFIKQLKLLKDQLGFVELYPYLFRKSRATSLAEIMPEMPLKKYMGWTVNSDMAKHYLFMDGAGANEILVNKHKEKTHSNMLDQFRQIIREEVRAGSKQEACSERGILRVGSVAGKVCALQKDKVPNASLRIRRCT